MFFIKLFYSLLLIGGGALLIKYRKTVKSWTGNFVWAERFLGNGGTYVALIFFGLLLIFIGVLYLFGKFHFGGDPIVVPPDLTQ